MTEEGKFVSVPDFKRYAMDEDYRALENFIATNPKDFKSKDNPNPEGKYLFSISAARELVKDWHAKQQPAETIGTAKEDSPGEVVLEFAKTKQVFNKRSIMVVDEQWERLQAVYDKYPYVEKAYVLQAVLDKVLTLMGV